MKSFTMFAATAVVAMVSIDCTTAFPKYLDEIPNGALFEKSLGHAGSKYTLFGQEFSKVGTWTEAICKAFYPGTDIPNGKAFGDPCCTWKKGGKADKTVTPWTDKPTTATECANSAPSVTPSPAATTAAPATPTATTAAPSPGGKPTTAPGGKPTTAPAATTAAPSPGGKPTTAPAGKPTTTPSGGDGKPSGKPSKCNVKKERKSLDVDDETVQGEGNAN